MTDMQTIEALCAMADLCVETIHDLAMKLRQVNAYDEADKEAVAFVDKKYNQIFENYGRDVR